MLRKTTLVAGLMVAAMVLSSCWTITAGRVNAKELAPGGTTRIIMDLRPNDSDSTVVGYPFVLVGYDNIDPRIGRTFDGDGNYGGPWQGVIDNTINGLMQIGSGACGIGSVDVSDIWGDYDKWSVYRTPVALDQSGPDPRLLVDHAVKRPVAAANGTIGELAIFSGIWNDLDTDGVPEAGELACAGSFFTSVPYVP